MGERSEAVQQECEAELDSIAARLCTALTTLHDYPVIRYRVGKPPEAGDAPGASVRSLLAQRLAQKVCAGHSELRPDCACSCAQCTLAAHMGRVHGFSIANMRPSMLQQGGRRWPHMCAFGQTRCNGLKVVLLLYCESEPLLPTVCSVLVCVCVRVCVCVYLYLCLCVCVCCR
jgi:hypothetical protein